MAHVLKIGMLASEAPENKKRKENPPDDFDFEKPTLHEIFQMPDQVSGPDANTVVADPVAIGDLKIVIGELSDAVMSKYGIEYFNYGMSGVVWEVPEGTEKFKARLDDIEGFVAHIDKPRVAAVVWSTFRKLVLGFSAIESIGDEPSKTLVALDKAAISSGFLPDATTGVYYFDPEKTEPYTGS